MLKPSRSATTCAKVVSCPWPCACEPVNTVTVPVGGTRTSPASNRPPQLDRVELHLACRGFHQTFDHVGRLGAAGAAIGIDWRGVGEYGRDLAVDRRGLVLAGEQRGVEDGRDAGGERREVGAEVRGG